MESFGNKITSATKNISSSIITIIPLGDGLVHLNFMPRKLISMFSFFAISVLFCRGNYNLKILSAVQKKVCHFLAHFFTKVFQGFHSGGDRVQKTPPVTLAG
jgi:hypothetical protein